MAPPCMGWSRPRRWSGGSMLAVACLAAVAVASLQLLCCRCGLAACGGDDVMLRSSDFGRMAIAEAHSDDMPVSSASLLAKKSRKLLCHRLGILHCSFARRW
ncbi:hypothetical protein GUJ93_ZPchr0001g32723 [Zizania palustris]|uniref:Uncharacterized protein n=1 Tax=Zizania palustris TaxID=103762 RepID=A0A8J5RUY5_ZIZPA|nr:hypothetical protein GUJ93_ZPchr0001g32723 [Zizania palustris]